MNNRIVSLIRDYVKNYKDFKKTKTNWRDPIIGFADANDPLFFKLKEVVSPSHALPSDFMDDAKSMIVFFLPFEENVIKSNISGTQSSKEWYYAKIETNNLIVDLSDYLYDKIAEIGYASTKLPPSYNYDREKLISDWSHRHVGYVAGIGTFGINNMFITDKGCCGRIGSIITNLPLEPTKRIEEENCLFKYNETCGQCINRCVVDAIKIESRNYYFDRERCYKYISANTPNYSIGGSAIACGKCKCGVPCSMTNPIKELSID